MKRLAALMKGPALPRAGLAGSNKVVHTGELLGAQALDIQQTVGIDVENGEGPVHYARGCAKYQFHDDAGLANALSGKVGNTSDVFPPEHSQVGRAGKRVQRVVSGKQKQP